MANSFATRIKALRSNLCATQAAFAETIGTTQTALSSYEQGDRMPSVEILITISKTFEVSVDWLLGLSDTKNIDNKPETMGDILKMLFTIEDHCRINIYRHAEEFHDLDYTTGCPGLYERDTYEIGFENNTLNSLVSEWDKMYSLYQDGTIDKEVYSLWVEKTIKKADTFTPDGNKNYESISDDGIPF